jgi:hypothetical protein
VRCSSSLSTLGPFLLLLPGDESLVWETGTISNSDETSELDFFPSTQIA